MPENQAKPQDSKLEEEYIELLKTVTAPIPTPTYHDNLAQPPALRIVDSVTTYGAYEKPI